MTRDQAQREAAAIDAYLRNDPHVVRRLPLHGFDIQPRRLGKSRTLAREIALNVALVAVGFVCLQILVPITTRIT